MTRSSKASALKTLVYKRTHTGDPDRYGRFGIHGCMGRVRAWAFDAVIGIGGMGAEPTADGIDGRITWIGIGPRKVQGKDPRAPLVTFDRFILFDRQGPFLYERAPHLARRMYERGVRALLYPSPVESKEISGLLDLARGAPPSRARSSRALGRVRGCRCGKRHSSDCPNRRRSKGSGC
jgi:hypothetical protein